MDSECGGRTNGGECPAESESLAETQPTLRHAFRHVYGFILQAVRGEKAAADAIDKLKAVHQVKPSSINLQVLFNAKYDELVNLFKPDDPEEKNKVYNTLQIIDPGHITQYQKMVQGS